MLTPEQIRPALRVLDARERLIFGIGRLRRNAAWRDSSRSDSAISRKDSILVDQSVYKGNIDTPKGRRGQRTSHVVGLSPGTLIELRAVAGKLANRCGPAGALVSD